MGEMAAALALLLAAANALEIREPGKTDFSTLSQALQAPEQPKSAGVRALEKLLASPGPMPPKLTKAKLVTRTASAGKSNSADSLQDEIAEMQKMHSTRLQQEFSVYEKKLKAQERANQEMEAENARLTKDVNEIHQTNAKLYQNAHALEKDIIVHRREVALLTGQLKNAVNLMNDSYTKSDMSAIPELDVLHLGDADKKKFVALLSIKEGQDSDAEPLMNLLSRDIIINISSSAHDQDSEVQEAFAAADAKEKHVMTKLLTRVKDMQAQGKEQEDQLKAKFLTGKEALEKIHEALNTKNLELKNVLSSEKEYAARLIAAVKKMKEVKASLEAQIHDGGLFMKQLANVATRKPNVAVQQLEAAQAVSHRLQSREAVHSGKPGQATNQPGQNSLMADHLHQDEAADKPGLNDALEAMFANKPEPGPHTPAENKLIFHPLQ